MGRSGALASDLGARNLVMLSRTLSICSWATIEMSSAARRSFSRLMAAAFASRSRPRNRATPAAAAVASAAAAIDIVLRFTGTDRMAERVRRPRLRTAAVVSSRTDAARRSVVCEAGAAFARGVLFAAPAGRERVVVAIISSIKIRRIKHTGGGQGSAISPKGGRTMAGAGQRVGVSALFR